jgi:hypothetical protein
LTFQSADPQIALSRIIVELFDETGASIARTEYVTDDQTSPLKAYKSLVEGFPDRNAEITPTAIAQEIVPGIIRGNFA